MNSFTLINLNTIESIEIGDDCFENVNEFVIDGLKELKSLKIGNNSFTKEKNSQGNDYSRSFHILNCIELKSIEIGRYSFSDYGGGFELKNLPKLTTIIIGSIESDFSESNNRGWSANFAFASFVIKGIIYDDIANE